VREEEKRPNQEVLLMSLNSCSNLVLAR